MNADPTTMEFAIEYADGVAATGIPPSCIRAYRPYVLGEELGLTHSRTGTVLSILDDGTYDILLKDPGDHGGSEPIVVRASAGELHRYQPTEEDVEI